MSILDSGRTTRLPGMSLATTLLLLISLCFYDYYYSNEKSPPLVPRVAAATPPPPVTPFVRARKEASLSLSPLESNDDFPAIYDMTVPKSELTHNLLVREWIANLDLLTMKCNDAESSSGGTTTTTTSRHHDRSNAAFLMTTCRLTMLVHSENEYHSLMLGWGQQSHHQHVFHGIQRNQEATLGLWHNRQKSLKDHDLLSQSNPDRPPIMDATRVDDPATDESTVTTTRRLTGDYSRISGFPCMFNYEGTMQWIQDLVDEQQEQQGNTSTSLRSDVTLTWTDIGDSYLKTKNSTKGHDIRVLKISGITANNNRNGSSTFEKAPFLILTGVHPREYAPPELVRRWIHWLVTTKTDVKARLLLETTDVYWIPYVNPDGRVLAETSEIYRRKNVNRESSGQQTCQESEYGVDLNRNFPFRYGRDDGSSSSPCSEVFRGSGPASEPEVQAVIRLGDTIFPKSQRMETIDQTYLDQGLPQAYNETTTRGVFLDIHSFGNTYIYVSTSCCL